jgi:outer membrane protein OmpA-like peptidoglycan-associated protein/tetratricopeptide (TPR) repeat protein
MADLLEVQEEIAREIGSRLVERLGSDSSAARRSSASTRAASEPATADPEAYRLYLKGSHQARTWSVQGFRNALELFQHSVAIDPAYARSHAGLAYALVLMGFYAFIPGPEVFPKAKAAAKKAIELDPSNAEAYAALSLHAMQAEHDFPLGIRLAEQATRLDPNSTAKTVGDSVLNFDQTSAASERDNTLWFSGVPCRCGVEEEMRMRSKSHESLILSIILLALAGGITAFAQDGKLNIHVTPKQAYIFVDGRAISEASKHHTLSLSAGDHKIELVNYGYQPADRTVTIIAGKATDLEVTLQAVAPTVSGPFGAMTIEGADRDAVLLNGKTPDYFVGHGDEFNHDWWWKQELVVPPGAYQVTVLHEDKEVWSGPVTVPANQRVVVDIPKGVRKTVAWPRGEKLSSIPRFTVGTASATVAVAKPTAELSTTTAQLNCGDSSQLKWSASDAPHVEISPIGPVAASGEQAIQPKQTTTYNLTATGPGGTAISSTTVNVNNAIQASLGLSPAEIRYKRVGDKVIEESNSALNWTATNASTVSIDPLGSVDPSGSRSLQVAPRKSDPGAVDETVTYTLAASNDCGGIETRTATLHIVGSIEQPEIKLSMRSVYFPTDRPRTLKMNAALLPSEQDTLKSLADAFKQYLMTKSDARLVLSGNADKRGPEGYNKALSERRAELAKRFLVEQGVPEANLETRAYGKEQNLSFDQVKQLIEQDSSLTSEDREKAHQKSQTIVLAYNRRVDFTLSTTGQESARVYPFETKDFALLVDRNGPRKEGTVELAAQKEKIKK